jgi:hypothetical protein
VAENPFICEINTWVLLDVPAALTALTQTATGGEPSSRGADPRACTFNVQ